MVLLIVMLIFFFIIFGSLWPFMFIIGGVAILFVVLLWISSKSKEEHYDYDVYEPVPYNEPPTYNYSSESDRIGSTVSHQLYNEIKNYCGSHQMTISDLIRSSVREYMDNHQ